MGAGSGGAIAAILPAIKTVLWRIFSFGALLYVAVGAYGYFLAERQIFPAPPVGYGVDEPNLLTFNAAPDVTLRAVHLTRPDAIYTLLLSHGNGSDLGSIRANINQLHQLGFNVFAYDYRGYGLSDGTPTEAGIYQDVEAAYRHLREQGVPADRIIPYGISIGGAPSIHIAATQPVAGLVLEATFTSIFRVVTRVSLYPFDKFPNLQRLKEVSVPIVIFHGTQDEIIPFYHGQQLAQVHPQRTEFVAIANGTHNDLPWVAGEAMGKTLINFTQKLSKNN
ncbi:MAG: alpha/beta hydrolase [Cyanobacteria bacterium P01_F01_bin.153]